MFEPGGYRTARTWKAPVSMKITSTMVRSVTSIESKIRRWVAAHEAGHAAVSLALGQGHQEGVVLSLDGDVLGSHVVGHQMDFAVLPRPLALFNGVRHAMVSLAGPMAQAKAEGVEFDISEFLAGIGEPGSDAAQVARAVDVLARHLHLREAACLLVEDLVEATASVLGRPDVTALAEAIAQALIRRGRVGGDGLDQMLSRYPIAHELVTVPRDMVRRWELSAVAS